MEKTFANYILEQQFSLTTKLPLPDGVEYLFPIEHEEVRAAMTSFYQKYFSDQQRRIALLGINPGRFGAGITGVPFTDPIRLEDECHIPNSFSRRQELSSIFVFDVIESMGGLEYFYKHCYITSICPLGFVKDGKNYNYYDDRYLEEAVLPMIKRNFSDLLQSGIRSDVAFSMGKGKNFKFLQKINKVEKYFDQVIALPHPRWVMQYRLKRKDEFVQEYCEKLSRHLK